MRLLKAVVVFLFLFNQTAFTQILEPAKWQFSKEYLGNHEYMLYFDVKLDPGWSIYSQYISDEGPVPTSFHFEKNKKIQLIGNVEESGEKVKEGMDPIFEIFLKKFSGSARFSQKVKVEKGAKPLKGYLEFMTCDEEKCLPPAQVEFQFSFDETSAPQDPASGKSETSGGILEPVKWSFRKEAAGQLEYNLIFEAKIDSGWYLYSQHIGGSEEDLRPVPTSFHFEKSEEYVLIDSVQERGKKEVEGMDPIFEVYVKKYSEEASFIQRIRLNNPDAVVKGYLEFMTCDDEKCLPPQIVEFSFSGNTAAIASAVSDNGGHQRTLLGIFLAGFVGGILALLTPCVFPMIPMTVSFFTKTSKTRSKGIANAITYGISIIVIYVLVGFAVTKMLGADALNAMASNAFFNLTFFVVFVVFAISFFGYFEITFPSALVNKVDKASDKGGLIGIFFMAFTLALVSFSCTGPIIGTLLVEAAMRGNNLGPLLGMFGFSLALALPFGLFAAFPGWLNTLPRSGGWLNSVKVVLGFLELALALKFLSNVDLAYHWGFLKREIFLGIWMLIFLCMGLYILGLIRFPHDSKVARISFPRAAFATLTFAFVIYLGTGLTGAPLKLLSGFPPPTFYSLRDTGSKCPHDINCFKDLQEGIAYARLVKKPVIIDFTGWSCVNCRKMEENVWVEPEVLRYLKEEYVLISLYVDDKTALPKSEQKVSPCTGKMIKTVGNKWSEYQACAFNTNSQPYYVLMTPSQELLNTPRGYTPDKERYIRFLQEGLEKFRNGNS
ncbi:MAG: thiol:disulfide interchange protein [Chitinophagales bacterium]|nr:MAG: thiol:disulfide interchange protein [Chitinophagales bacterium]